MSLLDKVNDRLYKDLNRFVDGGDVGDLYNYCPPLEDRLVDTAAAPPHLELVESWAAAGYAAGTADLPSACFVLARSGNPVQPGGRL